jgi:hypothetical protein
VRIAAVIVVLLALVATTRADEGNERPSLLESENLSGDWNGWRPRLEKDGIRPYLVYTGSMWSNVSGGIRTGTEFDGYVDAGFGLDLEKLGAWRGLGMQMSLHWFQGRQPTMVLVGANVAQVGVQLLDGPRYVVDRAADEPRRDHLLLDVPVGLVVGHRRARAAVPLEPRVDRAAVHPEQPLGPVEAEGAVHAAHALRRGVGLDDRALGDLVHVLAGAREPAPRVVARVGDAVEAEHHLRVQRLQREGADAADDRRRVVVDAPGERVRAEVPGVRGRLVERLERREAAAEAGGARGLGHDPSSVRPRRPRRNR